MTNKHYEFIAVDFQKEFADPQGKFYVLGSSISFINNILLPIFIDKKIMINEIVSDYRQPRPSHTGNYCDPNEPGYESMIPSEIKKSEWVKAMHNPIWIRDNGGRANQIPGIPYPAPNAFNEWLVENIGLPHPDLEVIIFGLTLEVCVASVAQELYYRGYKAKIIYEASDPMNERLDLKDFMIERSPITLYAEFIHFCELLSVLNQSVGTTK